MMYIVQIRFGNFLSLTNSVDRWRFSGFWWLWMVENGSGCRDRQTKATVWLETVKNVSIWGSIILGFSRFNRRLFSSVSTVVIAGEWWPALEVSIDLFCFMYSAAYVGCDLYVYKRLIKCIFFWKHLRYFPFSPKTVLQYFYVPTSDDWNVSK